MLTGIATSAVLGRCKMNFCQRTLSAFLKPANLPGSTTAIVMKIKRISFDNRLTVHGTGDVAFTRDVGYGLGDYDGAFSARVGTGNTLVDLGIDWQNTVDYCWPAPEGAIKVGKRRGRDK